MPRNGEGRSTRDQRASGHANRDHGNQQPKKSIPYPRRARNRAHFHLGRALDALACAHDALAQDAYVADRQGRPAAPLILLAHVVADAAHITHLAAEELAVREAVRA